MTVATTAPNNGAHLTNPRYAERVAQLDEAGLVGPADLPVEVTGERDVPESALANLLEALETAGIIVDSTVETGD